MPTFTQRVTVGTNDFGGDADAAAPNSFNHNSHVVDFSAATTDENSVTGLRYTNVTIPAGSTITSATIDFVFLASYADRVDADILLNDVDNAVAPTNATGLAALVRTTASTPWNDLNAGYTPAVATSPDFKTSVQEVIDRGGWASGQAIIVLMVGTTLDSDSNIAQARSSDYDIANATTLAPIITIEYTTPSALGSTNLLKSTLLSSTLLSSTLIRS